MATAPTVSSSHRLYVPTNVSSYKENLPGVYKVQKIALNIIAGLSLTVGLAVGGAAIFSSVTFPVGLSVFIVLVAVAGAFALLSRNVVDYNDPKVQEILREQTNTSSFDQLVKRHGLKVVLKYFIPEPVRFKEIVKEKIQSLSFTEARKFHIQLMMVIEAHTSTQIFPEFHEIKTLIDWKSKWCEETRGLPACAILERYPIQLLENCPGFDDRELNFLRDAKIRIDRSWGEYKRKMKDLAASFETQIKPHQLQLERAISQADESYVAKWDPEKLTVIQAEYNAEVKEIDTNMQAILAQIQGNLTAIEIRLKDRGLSNPQKVELVNRQKYFVVQRAAAVQNTDRLKSQALERFTEKRRACARDIQTADTVRQSEYEAAQTEFARQSTLINQQRDQSIANYKEDHIFVKQEINEDYLRLIV